MSKLYSGKIGDNNAEIVIKENNGEITIAAKNLNEGESVNINDSIVFKGIPSADVSNLTRFEVGQKVSGLRINVNAIPTGFASWAEWEQYMVNKYPNGFDDENHGMLVSAEEPLEPDDPYWEGWHESIIQIAVSSIYGVGVDCSRFRLNALDYGWSPFHASKAECNGMSLDTIPSAGWWLIDDYSINTTSLPDTEFYIPEIFSEKGYLTVGYIHPEFEALNGTVFGAVLIDEK